MFSGQKIKLEDFEAAAMPHFDDLYRTAVRVIGDRTEAEDLVQETYLQGWKSFHRFEPGTNCRAWLFKILFHVIHHHRRKWFSLNLVKDGALFQKKHLELPKTLRNIVECMNPRCITSAEEDADQVFTLVDPERGLYRCVYCEARAEQQEP